GGIPLGIDVVKSAIATRGGADTLAAVSIIASVLLGEWLVAAIVVLMLSGGEALEEAASKRASATLDALARRAPQIATAGTRTVRPRTLPSRRSASVMNWWSCPMSCVRWTVR